MCYRWMINLLARLSPLSSVDALVLEPIEGTTMPAQNKPGQTGEGQGSAKTENNGMDQTDCADSDAPNVILDAKIQAQLGRELSVYYNDLVKQPVPDTFINLLKQLDKSERGE